MDNKNIKVGVEYIVSIPPDEPGQSEIKGTFIPRRIGRSIYIGEFRENGIGPPIRSRINNAAHFIKPVKENSSE